MRLPDTAHTSRPWRIHEVARDFRLEDVWALPTPGGPDDFPLLVQTIASGVLDPSQGSSRVARLLFSIRLQAGQLLGWDGPDSGISARVPSLRNRVPADLRDAASGPELASFDSLYLLDHEFAAEIANRTVHAVLHLGWVEDEDPAGGFRGQMAILVRPNGWLGRAYMAAIKPFRHLVVYPAMMKQIERGWARAVLAQPRPGAST